MTSFFCTRFFKDRNKKNEFKQYYAKIVGYYWSSNDIRQEKVQEILGFIKQHKDNKQWEEMVAYLRYIEAFMTAEDWNFYRNWCYYYWSIYYKFGKNDPLLQYIYAKMALRGYDVNNSSWNGPIHSIKELIAETEKANKSKISDEQIVSFKEVFYIPKHN